MSSTIGRILSQPMWESLAPHGHAEMCDVWFARYRELLHSTACRVLGCSEGAALAVQNCWLAVSRKRPRFDREVVFRSWLVRVLINEALAILRAGHEAQQ